MDQAKINIILFLRDNVFIKFDHAGILKKENGFQNYFCEFLLGFLAHSFSFLPPSQGTLLAFIALLDRVSWRSVDLQAELGTQL